MDLARRLGVAFQILNDIRDLDDDRNDRRCGEDLSAGKLTYVIVRALERLSGPDRKRLEQIICNKRLRKNPEHLAEGMRLVRKSGAAGACKKEAEEMVESGWNAFSSRIPASEHKLMLRLFSRGLVGDRKQKRGPA